MNDDERRRYDRAWNDPPMFTMDQMNKQPTSAVPLNKRYKYPVADQQMLNNQMYPQAGNYMQNAYGQSAYGAVPNQLSNQYSQQQPQSAYTQNPSMAAAYNQQISNAYMGAQSLPGQQQQAYGYAAQQQAAYAAQQQQQQPQHYSPYGQQAGHQLSNQSIVSQQPLAGTNQLSNQSAYQNPQTSAYLPNTINPTVTTAINQQQSMNQTNPALAQTSVNQQIPISNAMMQSAYSNPMQSNPQQQQQQYNAQQQQQLYNQAAANQQYQLPNQYQY